MGSGYSVRPDGNSGHHFSPNGRICEGLRPRGRSRRDLPKPSAEIIHPLGDGRAGVLAQDQRALSGDICNRISRACDELPLGEFCVQPGHSLKCIISGQLAGFRNLCAQSFPVRRRMLEACCKGQHDLQLHTPCSTSRSPRAPWHRARTDWLRPDCLFQITANRH